jgi:RHS repeat-associated protein
VTRDTLEKLTTASYVPTPIYGFGYYGWSPWNRGRSWGWGWNKWSYSWHFPYKLSRPTSYEDSEVYTYANGSVLLEASLKQEQQPSWGWGWKKPNPELSNARYHHQDELGSSILVTDGTGAVKEGIQYDAWGVITGPKPSNVDFGYTGKPLDKATGFYEYGFRDYLASQGRFITVDPIRDGANWYAYCGGNPVVRIDPDGRIAGIPTDIEKKIALNEKKKADPSFSIGDGLSESEKNAQEEKVRKEWEVNAGNNRPQKVERVNERPKNML